VAKKYPLTESQFDELAHLEGWTIEEIPRSTWEQIPGLPRKAETIAVMGSGNFPPGALNGISAVVGLDVLAHETRPKPGEKPGNAYHMVIQKIADQRYPYLMHGPFKSETLVPHHFEAEDLNVYFKNEPGEMPSSP
jgi:hypothetical protein